MHTSILMAKLIGPVLLVAGLANIINPKTFREVAGEFLRSRALIFIAGFLALLGGLAIVNTHHVWTGWPVIITVLGWSAVIAGILRMAFPSLTRSIGEAMLAREEVLRVASGVWLLLGAFLTFMGYR